VSGLSNHVNYLRLFSNNFAAAVGIVIARTEEVYICVCAYICVCVCVRACMIQ